MILNNRTTDDEAAEDAADLALLKAAREADKASGEPRSTLAEVARDHSIQLQAPATSEGA